MTIMSRGTQYTIEFDFDRPPGIEDSPLVIYMTGGVSGLGEKLYANIEEKARRYGVQDKPFVIGIWQPNGSGTVGEQAALFGRPSVVVNRNSNGEAISAHGSNTNDGIFYLTEEGQRCYKNVSAVAFYQYKWGGQHHIHEVHVYHNPFASYPLSPSVFPDQYQMLVEGDGSGGADMVWTPCEPE